MDDMKQKDDKKDVITREILQLAAVSNKILKREAVYKEPCLSLVPLALSLKETCDLYSKLLHAPNSMDLQSLFDGGEELTPNIDTRLKCIRDLCSASIYGLKKRSQGEADQDVEYSAGPGQEYWIKIIEAYTNTDTQNNTIEAAKLLDDLLESMIAIAHTLSGIFDHGNGSWNEAYRHAKHIRDHYDYAEDFIISCLRE